MVLKAFLILAALGSGEDRQQPEPAPTRPAVEESAPVAISLDEPEVASTLLPAAPTAPAAVASMAPAEWTLLPFDAVRVAARPGADAVVGKVQKFYESTKHLTAKFRQTYTNETFGTTRVSDGRLYIKKPGKMRWDYYAKKRNSKKAEVEKTFVSDGKMLWAVEHDQKQYAKQDLKKNMLPVAITFLYGKGDLRRDFTATLDGSGTYGKKSDYVLKLIPKTPSAQYKTLYLVVDPGNFRVKQSIVVEASGNTNHFQFFEPDTQKPVLDSWFVFNEKKFKGKYRLVNINKQQGTP